MEEKKMFGDKWQKFGTNTMNFSTWTSSVLSTQNVLLPRIYRILPESIEMNSCSHPRLPVSEELWSFSLDEQI